MSNKTSVKPVIQGSQIVSIEVQDVSLPLREALPLDKLSDLVEAVETFFRYVDVEKLGETLSEEDESLNQWKESDLRKFVLTQLRDSQAIALGVLADTKEITREDFVKKMKKSVQDEEFRGWSLGGLLAGITMKSKSWGYESPYNSEWRAVRSEWQCFYYLRREEYRPIIQKALKERE
jgi:hypothetical protein